MSTTPAPSLVVAGLRVSLRGTGDDIVDDVSFSIQGKQVTAIIAKDNIAATQFHPEKSQDSGIELMSNFLRWNP